MLFNGKVGQESIDLRPTHLTWMAPLMEPQEASEPALIRSDRSSGVVT
jgi:hypothetical protein